MDETVKRVLMDTTKVQAFIVQSLIDDPRLQELAKQVVTEALTRTLRGLEEKQ